MLSIEEKLNTCFEPELNTGCWLWTRQVNELGYGILTHGKGNRQLAHRASYRLHCGDIPDGKVVCHRCDTPGCINPNHLWLGTLAENMHDMYRKGRWGGSNWPKRRGASHLGAKLTEADVLAMRHDARAGERYRVLSAKYGVCGSAVAQIVTGKLWSHVPDAQPHRRRLAQRATA